MLKGPTCGEDDKLLLPINHLCVCVVNHLLRLGKDIIDDGQAGLDIIENLLEDPDDLLSLRVHRKLFDLCKLLRVAC